MAEDEAGARLAGAAGPQEHVVSVAQSSTVANQDLTAADVQYYMQMLRAWQERTDTTVMRRHATREALCGPPRAARGVPLQMSAPVGGSLAMRDAASAATAAAAGQRPPLRPAPAPGAGGQESGAMAGAAPEPAGEEPDYDQLRQKLEGLAKSALVELWIQEHRRLHEHGLTREAQDAYDTIMQRAADETSREKRIRLLPSRVGEATGIDLLLRDGLLSFLLRINQFIPPIPSQVVKVRSLSYSAKVRRTETGYDTVGTKLLACLLPCLKPPAPTEDFPILHDLDMFLMPGSITLVCGPPGCGKTSVHKAVAGRLEAGKGRSLSGEVTFNNTALDQLKPRRLAAFVGQTDQHFPDLTVLETCKFAQDCNRLFTENDYAPLLDLKNLLQTELGGIDLKLQFTLYLLGLRNAADTIVGSKTKRGVSGGERHRVTTAEMLSGAYVVYCFDEISTGLDSSATYDIVSALRTIARVRQTTLLFSLLQPPPDVFNLFDRVVVVHQGRVIYQGPREDVLHYFESLGYTKPAHVDTADFIQEVPTDSGLEFLRPGMKHLSVDELEARYKDSPYYAEVQRVLNHGKDSTQVQHVIWAEAPTALGLTFKEGQVPGTVVLGDMPVSGPLAEPDIAFTAQLAEGDTLTALEVPPAKTITFLAPAEGVPAQNGAGEGHGVVSGRDGPLAGVVRALASTPQDSKVLLQVERPLKVEDSPTFDKYEQDYAREFWPSTKLVVWRQFTLSLRNRSFILARMMQMLVIGVFAGTVFFQIPGGPALSDLTLRLSINFLTIMQLALGSFSLIPALLDERQIIQKQLDARFFRPTSYVIASSLAQVPFNLAEVLILTPLIYWLTGMTATQNGSHFILFVLVGFLADIMGGALIRMLAAVMPSREAASGLAGLCVVTFLLFAGFILVKNSIPPWWIWFYYINPIQYAITALNVNEFLSGSYSQLCSSLSPEFIQTQAPYCVGQGDAEVGVAFLAFFQLPTSFAAGVWGGIGALIGFYILFTSLTFLAVSNLRFNQNKMPPADRLAPLPPRKRGRIRLGSLAKLPGSVASLAQGLGEGTQAGAEDPAQGQKEEGRAFEALGATDTGPRAASADASAPLVGGVAEAAKELDEVEGGVEAQGGTGGHGEAVRFVPTVLSWHDLIYEVDVPGESEPKVLLKSISGFSKPHTMTALMGSSGAGKTTLLDVLAGRKTMGRTRGDILINGFPKVQATFARIAGYVEQNDIHTPYITVRESLEFSAALRLPKSASARQRRATVDEAMDLLELNPIAQMLVGFIGVDGLTVEQAKRLSIGVELVSNPSILFLDEPTSGLDSRAAQIVIRGVENVVSTGRSVVCTIHQPSRRLFFAFDHLYLMKRGGEVVYFGPLGPQGSLLVGYFESLPGLPKCRDDENPATYMLEMIGAGIGHSARRDFALDYKESELADSNQDELDALRLGKGDYGAEPTARGYAASYASMFLVVTRRQFRTYWRNVSYSWGRMMFSIVLGLLLGSAFWQISSTSIPSMSSRQGLIYITMVFVAIVNANNVIPQVNAERPVFYREKASNMYPPLFYDNSWAFVEFPYLAMSTLLLSSICLTMTGVASQSASAFFLFWLIFFLYSSTITFFGLMMAVLTPNAETATVIIPVLVGIWNITSGFMIPKDSIPTFWIWVYWLNPTQFALKGLLSVAFFCDTSPGSACGASGCATDPAACPACPCPRLYDANDELTWTFVVNQRALNYDQIYLQILALIGFIIVFRIGGFLALRFMQYNRR